MDSARPWFLQGKLYSLENKYTLIEEIACKLENVSSNVLRYYYM